MNLKWRNVIVLSESKTCTEKVALSAVQEWAPLVNPQQPCTFPHRRCKSSWGSLQLLPNKTVNQQDPKPSVKTGSKKKKKTVKTYFHPSHIHRTVHPIHRHAVIDTQMYTQMCVCTQIGRWRCRCRYRLRYKGHRKPKRNIVSSTGEKYVFYAKVHWFLEKNMFQGPYLNLGRKISGTNCLGPNLAFLVVSS